MKTSLHYGVSREIIYIMYFKVWNFLIHKLNIGTIFFFITEGGKSCYDNIHIPMKS